MRGWILTDILAWPDELDDIDGLSHAWVTIDAQR